MSGERGSALVLAVLIMAVLTLLGVSYLLIGDTENKIAENERLAAQALYFAEGAVREVKRWFDRPPYSTAGASNLTRPTTSVMDRTRREIDTDGPGPLPAFDADGSPARPYYKDNIFDKPYRDALVDMFVGTSKERPDIRMDRATGGATATFLDALSEKIMPGFPAGGAGILARVQEINVYAPPYLDSGGGIWIRYGVATVSVRVQIIRATDATLLADRTVTAVVNEAPYSVVYGPLHSCDELAWDNVFRVRWGPATAAAGADMPGPAGPVAGMPLSIARDIPATPKVDLLHGHVSPGTWTIVKDSLEGLTLEDPWFRFFAGLGVVNWNTYPSPQPFPQDPASPPDPSNRFQNYPNVSCPDFNYETWKAIARSGGSDVHYFSWAGGQNFLEQGATVAQDFQTLTDGRTGLFFFDTRDGLAPHTFDAGNVAVNLTPPINITNGSYGVRGFLYVNTEMWRVTGSPGRPATFTYPGEPFRDVNENGIYESGTEDWINLRYSTANLGDPVVVDQADTFNPPPAAPALVWNEKGPSLEHNAVVWGILYLSGQFDASGTPYYNGSVVTYAGTETGVKTAGTASLYWDPNIKDNWPPPGWDLPRVIVTRWQTDE